MSIFPKLRLFFECYKLAGFTGIISCFKYLFGFLSLDHLN